MNRTLTVQGWPWIDLVLLVAAFAAAYWVATQKPTAIEAALGLISTQAQYEGDLKRVTGPRPYAEYERELHRVKYQQAHPRSPLARINQADRLVSIKEVVIHIADWSRPFLCVASVGLGFVVIRRGFPGHGRVRWGPGKVAGALAFGLAGAALGTEFVLRRFASSPSTYPFGINPISFIWKETDRLVSISILSAWLILLASGSWRAERGWREWLGIGLGSIWIVNLVWHVFMEWIVPL